MSSTEKRKLTTLVADEFRFFRNWMGRPLTTGAVSPSGRALSLLMASFVGPDDGLPVIELGPGTGVVTAALIERGVAPGRIVSVEYNPDFCALLRRRFAGVRIVEGDAYAFNRTLSGWADGPVSAVVSSLPLFTRPPEARRKLIVEALDRLPPGRPFIQFSYALVPPIPAEAGRFTVERSPWVVMNLPPARVWVYRRLA
jgi:phosphatidylethanolamine/phosphatidyl-N-methylethanolamine N-methyltransferase